MKDNRKTILYSISTFFIGIVLSLAVIYNFPSIFSKTIVKEEKNVTITDRYHHISSYNAAPSIIKNGILSVSDLHKKGIIKFSEKELKLSEDIESHVNGSDRVSLAVVGLDDLYADEYEFNPFKPASVDFIISSDVKTSRSSTHYGNEFLSYGSIKNNMIKSVDVRLFEYLDKLNKLKV